MRYNKINVDDCKVFYREAGDRNHPAILLLHGFPSSSHQFRELIPQLADEYYVIAPDFPGFGQTEAPDRDHFDYTFEHLTDVIDHFTEAVGLTQFAMYVFDYGAPIGFRIAVRHPERILAIVSQNGNIYQEGLGKKVGSPRRVLEKTPRPSCATSTRAPLPPPPSSGNTRAAPSLARWAPTATRWTSPTCRAPAWTRYRAT